MNKQETEFNAELRKVLRTQGLSVIHIREADQPGVLDLMCYDGDRILGWLELKVDDEGIRTSQREFMRERVKTVEDCYVVRLSSLSKQITVTKPNYLDGVFHECTVMMAEDYRGVAWGPTLRALNKMRIHAQAV